MSSDCGIYIAKFTDGYRVTKIVSNIENIDYFPEGSKKRKKELKYYFGKSDVYKTQDEAFEHGFKLAKDDDEDNEKFGLYLPLEYGVCFVGEYENF